MFHFILAAPWFVVVLRFVPALPLVLPTKLTLAAVLLVASQHLLINRITSGSVFSPEYPRPFIILLNLLFGAMVFLAVFQIALDLMSLIIAAAKGRFPQVPVEVRYAMGVVAVGLAAYAVSQAICLPAVKNVDITIAGLPPEFEGYRILQLTDLHISRLFPARWAEALASSSNALDVDLIAITGDFIDGTVEKRRDDVAPLAMLRARDGVLGIPGNHEYFFGYDDWMRHDRSLGIQMLENQHVVLKRGDASLVIAGVTDLAASRSSFPAPNLNAAIRDAPAGVPIILLDHQPRMAEQAAKSGVALQLSGHTHGGMVTGLDRLVARSNNGFVSGRYNIGTMQLYVNNGTALWPGFALRIGRPSELTVFILRGSGKR
ncbi:metallophosphoesterase [Rhizobium terrae]|uniref:metallophosphoesterase n=1 Tax=Rhizobium terrae TaxID=2171756 RepID=UPI000E3D5F49|nr:metallophosphoesterase [Rhizobium terrae]